MPTFKTDGKIRKAGAGQSIYLPTWFCRQFGVRIGRRFVLQVSSYGDGDETRLEIIFPESKKSIDKR